MENLRGINYRNKINSTSYIPHELIRVLFIVIFGASFCSMDMHAQSDKDNDGIIDFIDEDSDNDGILDVFEGVMCTTVDISELNGETDALNAFNDAMITVGGPNGALIQIENPLDLQGGAVLDEFIISNDHTGGPIGLLLGVTSNGPTQFLGTYYTFSQPVCDFNFDIYDLDRTDAITVEGFSNGMVVTYTVSSLGGCLVYDSANNLFENDPSLTVNMLSCDLNANPGNNNVADHFFNITFDGCIDSLAFTISDQGPGNGGSFTFVPTPQPSCISIDTDGDGIDDHLDLDSDNDGIPDAVEACGDTGLVLEDCTLDSDGDGNYIGMTGQLVGLCTTAPDDTDDDGIPDYLDLDSDNDGCSDAEEACTISNPNVNDSIVSDGYGTPANGVDDCGLVISDDGIAISCVTPISVNWIDDAIGCISCSITMVQDALCVGEPSGTATVIPTEGNQPYTYLWSPSNETTATAVALPAGTNTVTVFDACGIESVCEVEINDPVDLDYSALIMNAMCNGDASGQINLTPTGGVSPYSYMWSDGPTTENRSMLAAGNYSVLITDANDCEVLASFIINEPPSIAITINEGCEMTFSPGCDAVLSYTVTGGTPNYTISLTDANGNAVPPDAPGPVWNSLCDGQYDISVLDDNACFTSESFIVCALSCDLTVETMIINNVSCNGSSDGSATVTGASTSLPISYVWQQGVTNIGTGTSLDNLSAGVYKVIATDAIGCLEEITFVITEPDQLITTGCNAMAVTTVNGNDGEAEITATGGTPPYTYNWSNGQTSNPATNLSEGMYLVTITDANSCETNGSCQIQGVDCATFSVDGIAQNLTCNGLGDGSIAINVLGATGNVSYNWSPNISTTSTADNLAAGSYTITVSDQAMCTEVLIINITQPAFLTAEIDKENVSCFAAMNGSLDLQVTGGVEPYSFEWDNSIITEDQSSLGPDVYSVLITDKNECTYVAGAVIEEPAELLVDAAELSSVSCNGEDDGAIDITVIGGSQPYGYLWSNGETTEDIVDLVGGNYIVTITDVNGCQLIEQFTVPEPGVLSIITSSVTNVECTGESTGEIFIDISGGTMPYSISWTDGSMTEDRMGLAAGNYSAIVTDANMCTSTAQFTIIEPQSIDIDISIGCEMTFAPGCDAELSYTVSGGTPVYQVSIADMSGANIPPDLTDANGPQWNSLCDGEYNIMVVDANGCMTTESFIVCALSCDLTLEQGIISNVTCNGLSDGSATVVGTSSFQPITYTWSQQGIDIGTGTSMTNLPDGVYKVIAIDAIGCREEITFIIDEPAQITITNCSPTPVSTVMGSDGMAEIFVTGGTADYSYLWSNGQTSNPAIGLSEGQYSVTVTDANGCMTETICIIQGVDCATFSTSVNSTNVSCAGESDGDINISVLGATGNISYTWDPNISSTNMASELEVGNYLITVIDDALCQDIIQVMISQPSALTAEIDKEDISCFGDMNGTMDLQVNGGVEPYSFMWSNNVALEDQSNLPPGIYSVSVSDQNLCQVTSTVTISEPALLECMVSPISPALCDAADGSASVTITGGVEPYMIMWDNGESSETAVALTAGTHSVSINDANGCQTTCTVEVALNCNPCIEIIKSSDLDEGDDGVATPGDTITYTYEITNCGNSTLTDVAIAENSTQFTGSGMLPMPTMLSNTTLQPDEMISTTATYEITQIDINELMVVNQALAEGMDPFGNPVQDDSDTGNIDDPRETGGDNDPTTTILMGEGCLNLVKSSALDVGLDGIATVGDIITYNYVVTNCSNVMMTNVSIAEQENLFSGTGVLPIVSDVSPDALEPDEFGMATASYEITQADIDAGIVINSAIAVGNDPFTNVVNDISDSGNPNDEMGSDEDPTTTPIVIELCIELKKLSSLSIGIDGVASVGDVITYNYEFLNCGNATLSNFNIIEETTMFTGSGILPGVTNITPATLAPGESGTANSSYMITQDDIDFGFVDNQALITASDIQNTMTSDLSDTGNTNDINETDGDEDPTNTPIIQNPCLELVKSSSLDPGPDGIVAEGDIITYSYVVTNCGNVNLSGVSIIEDENLFSGTGTLPTPQALSSPSLSPGQSNSTTAQYALTQEDIDVLNVTNQAIANGASPLSEMVTDISDSGNSYDVTASPEDPTTTPIEEMPCISVLKGSSLDTGTDGIATPDDIITYSYEITNCGNVTLESIELIEDPNLFSGSGPDPVINALPQTILEPGESMSTTAMYAITQIDINAAFVNNQAIASAMSTSGTPVSDLSDTTNPNDVNESDWGDDPTNTILPPEGCLDLEKTATIDLGIDGIANPGDIIQYQYDVTNCGNVDVIDISILEDEDLFTGTGALPLPSLINPSDLGPTMSGSGTASYAITQFDIDAGFVTNVATATGTDPFDQPVKDESEVTVDIDQVPCVELLKGSSIILGSDNELTPGDLITYNYVITNCGNVSLVNVNIAEDQNLFTGTGILPVVVIPAGTVIPPGGSISTSSNYTITPDDLFIGKVDNQAIVNAESIIGVSVNDISDTSNENDPNETDGPDDPTNTALPTEPCIELIKSSSLDVGPNEQVSVGDIITYTYELTNCGFISVNDIAIAERTELFSGTGILPQPTAFPVTTLNPRETTISLATYAITQSDIDAGIIINQAIAQGISNVGIAVVDTSDSGNDYDDSEADDDPTTTPIVPCGQLACNGEVQIALSSSCEVKLTAEMLLEDSQEFAQYWISLSDEDGNFLRLDSIYGSDVGSTLNYEVKCGDNTCWGKISVEANVIPIIPAPCACTADSTIFQNCILWCGSEFNSSIISKEEAFSYFTNCGPELIGDINVEESIVGSTCDSLGETIELKYLAKFLIHGEIETHEILCQRYRLQKMDLEDPSFMTDFNFPRDITLECDYQDDIDFDVDFDFGSPESIYAATGSGSMAYPFFKDKHSFVDLIRIDTIIDHIVIDTIIREAVIEEDFNDDGEKEWALVKIVDKVIEEKFKFDTIVTGQVNPEVPIINAACNLQTSYTDIEFPLCGDGIKIVRDWIAIDWCDSQIQKKGSQTIFITDLSSPQIVNEQGKPITQMDDVITELDPWTCEARVKLPNLQVIDKCNSEYDVQWHAHPFTIKDGYIVDMKAGQQPVEVLGQVQDDCGNMSEVKFSVVVKDDVAPIPVCAASLQTALSVSVENGVGFSKVFADQFHEGSHDLGCGDVTITVVRQEDYSELQTNCEDKIIGYKPKSCEPITEKIYSDEKICGADAYDEISVPGDYVKFCCEDAGKIIYVIVIATDEAGNSNSCEVPVEVVNKVVPSIVCQDQNIRCDNGLVMEKPYMLGSLCEDSEYQIELLKEIPGSNICFGGTLIREWYIDIDGSGGFTSGDSYCRQNLLIHTDALFDPYDIKWPKHYDGTSSVGIQLVCEEDEVVEKTKTIALGASVNCTPENTDYMPSWCETECALVGYTQETDSISIDNGCQKILRRWTVIDWCTYDVNGVNSDDDTFVAIHDDRTAACYSCESESFESDQVYFRYDEVERDGHYTYEQIIRVVDDIAPAIEVESSFTVLTNGGAEDKDDVNDCLGEASIIAKAEDFCDGLQTSGAELSWLIKIFRDDELLESIERKGHTIEISTLEGSPAANHMIEWNVKDACGNSDQKKTNVTFIDNARPNPICIAGVSSSYSYDEGNIELWAKDFDFGSFDDCTSREDLVFTVVTDGDSPAQPGSDEFEDQARITFNCADFNEYVDLDIWVWDSSGNGSSCQAQIMLRENHELCPEVSDTMVVDTMVIDTMLVDSMEIGASHIIAGLVNTELGDHIKGATVTIESASPEYPKSWTTSRAGEYLFGSNPSDENYKINVSKDDDDLNGLSTLDLIFLSRHITGLKLLDSPYKLIAADANKDERVSAADIIEFKRLILNRTDELVKTESWIFIDAGQEFFDLMSPWPIREEIDIVALNNDMMQVNFMGIKIGDLNESADPLGIYTSEIRSNETLQFNTGNQLVQKNEFIDVDFTADNFNEIVGFQFTLSHEGLELIDIQSAYIDVEDYYSKGDMTSMLWLDNNPITAKEEVLFSIKFRASKDIELKDKMVITSDMTRSEAYTDFDIHNVGLVITEQTQSKLIVEQNIPNPFTEETNIPVYLSNDEPLNLTVFDPAGKIILERNMVLGKGYHEINFNANDLDTKGVLYYQITQGDEMIVKKMLVIK